MRRLHTTQLGLARLLVVASVGLWVHVHGAGAPTLRWDLMGQVIRILGADTIEVEVEGRRETIRYLGIQTPEVRYPARRKNATNATRKLVEGRLVRLEFDGRPRDRDGHLLAYVYVGEVMVNAELVRQGHARVATWPPDAKYQELLLSLEREARDAKRGLWGP